MILMKLYLFLKIKVKQEMDMVKKEMDIEMPEIMVTQIPVQVNRTQLTKRILLQKISLSAIENSRNPLLCNVDSLMTLASGEVPLRNLCDQSL